MASPPPHPAGRAKPVIAASQPGLARRADEDSGFLETDEHGVEIGHGRPLPSVAPSPPTRPVPRPPMPPAPPDGPASVEVPNAEEPIAEEPIAEEPPPPPPPPPPPVDLDAFDPPTAPAVDPPLAEEALADAARVDLD
ncbi:MAG: hypothetical protein OEV40_02500, partial [Acidimicrobiia bacterium]|nr:hypothetical protein [Acidimicrobiia bacterium]